ncbi:uncharacterized protein MAL13P1.304-like isoform X2 [Osmia bicornis bicornis]|uniref:uncharacterized protein MAL13P1.304-like isoform X2 n=1 Tax=Osmia bicornis bicornis TaxID=1437191 RepID=UPI001EAF62ED|nr:uncharacterized protein MAL13P1.304-like isoform X2 [Osmia bicornis bicornis]
MASDLSSECTETIGVLDEKEEGEISLEDVSSSEEGHLNYGYGARVSQCSNCLSTQHNAAWCTASAKFYPSKGSSNRREVDLILQDAVQGKENRHQIKESGCIGTKHPVSTLQEKNDDDLVPISSDSDMEIVGLADNSKQIVIYTSSKSRAKKKKKKKRNHAPVMTVDDLVSASTVDVTVPADISILKHDATKNNSSRSHHREISPVHKTSRSRVISRSPPRRHRSLIRARSPFRRSKSPIIRARSPLRRSPRRLKSPKRSPYRSSGKTIPRKTSHPEAVSSSHNYVDTHKLLKKVRKLDSIGTHSLEETLNKNKEHASSLKEKLTNMLKGVPDNNSDVTKDKLTNYVNKNELNDVDDEEDLALLRQKALETKQNKSSKPNDQPKTESGKKVNANINDDQDEEDLELRMIALRSAVLKKHQNRVQKGMKSGTYKKSKIFRSESPFSQSFLDSIPIPGEELSNFASPPHTPLPMNENNHTEDMELDTDVEREKEKLPYSPTDKITANIPMDTELLGIQPSDVSFINLNAVNNSPGFNVSMVPSQDSQTPYQAKIIENRSYLPNVVYYTPLQNSICATTNANIQYPTTDQIQTSKSDFMKVHTSHLSEQHYGNACNILKSNISEFADINSSQEMPYSPTDTPVYDPDLSHALPQTPGPDSSLVSLESYNSNIHGNSEQGSHVLTTQQTQTSKETISSTENEQLNKAETLSIEPIVGSATTSLMESVSPSSSMVTIDDFPETDADASPLTDLITKSKTTENIPNNLNNIEGTISEPLYMKGIPDITKDANKIPTLINRTLVPAPILKTNKQLQQPLSVKKSITQQEPTFKSAEMQPVIINEETTTKANTAFKPMKLISFPQKSHSVLAIPTVFHESLHDESTDETDKNIPLIEDNQNVIHDTTTTNTEDLNNTCDTKSSTQKKKKHIRRGQKRKSAGSISLATKKTALCKNNDNTNINKKIRQTSDIIHSDNKQNNEKLEKPDVKDNTIEPISEASGNVANHKSIISPEKTEVIPTRDILSNEALQEIKNAENRRESLDEDEEALRASLLASLPKRTKPSNNDPNSAATTVVSVTSTRALTNQTEPKITLPMVNTSSTIIRNSTTCLINLYSSENDKNQSNSRDKIGNTIPQGSISAETVKTLGQPVTSGRKRSLTITKGSQKKLMKRIAIPASTKVVNNAKKYQNTMLQKKLNLQKAVYNKQKITENKITSKVQSNDTKWSTSTKALCETQRIVINLGSDSESDSESERQKNKSASTTNSPTVDKSQSVTNSTLEFEKNLEQFLRDVRKKQESMAAARPTSISQTPKKDTVLNTKSEQSNSSNLHTPLAVRHLPAPQQEEYRRLKQQILEREKLKLHKTIENNTSVKNTNMEVSSKSVLSNSPNKKLYTKVNQTTFVKSQNINAQQLNKENCSKNLDSIKDTSISTNNIQLGIDRASSMERQENISPKLTKTMANLNIRVSTENNLNKTTSNSTFEYTTRKVIEIPPNKAQIKTKISPGLKILSSDEVNRKYVQVQVKNDTNERVVTINDKVTLNNKAVINRNENISENNDSNRKNDTDQVVQSVGKELTPDDTPSSNNDVDSDASTVILPKENRCIERRESIDTSESTVRLSDYQNNSRTSTSTENKNDSPCLSPKTEPLNDKISIEENWDAIKRDVKTELSTLINLSRVEQERHLMDTEQKLVMKRYTILDDLAEMSSKIRQWDMERDLQANLAAEVKKLREQLKVAEERLQLQRDRINNIGPKVVAAHGKINVGRQECFKLVTICSTLGSRIIGKEYKVPEAGAQLLDSRLKEVANHTRQLSRKKVPSIDIPEIYDLSKSAEETASTTYTEISQSESLLLEEYNVNNVDPTILNETNEAENTTSLEVTTVNVNEESSKQENVELNNVTLTNDNKDTSEQNNNEKKALTDQTKISDTNVATPSTSNSKDAQDKGSKKSPENNSAKPESPEVSNKEINSITSNQELQTKKTLLPYESILMHFKVPRNTNPNGVLCPYELMGTCSDGDCQFIHQTDSQAK